MFTAQFAGDPSIPRARKYPKDNLTQLGSSPRTSQCSLLDGVHCLGHVIACCRRPALSSPEQERSIFHLGGCRGDLHLSSGLSAAALTRTNLFRTSENGRQAHVVSARCVCDVKSAKQHSIVFCRAEHACVFTNSLLET